jgi:hypothetical protein
MFRQPPPIAHAEADRRRPRRPAFTAPRVDPARACGLLLIVALLGAAAFALVPATGRAQSSEEFAFRIAVRLTENGERLEFGIQRLDAEGRPRLLHLAHKRFFPLAVDHHRWLRGDSAFLIQAPYYDAADFEAIGRPPGVEGVDVKVVARLHPTRGQVEFGATYELDASQLPDSIDDAFVEPVLPSRRFFPSQAGHQSWLYSNPLQFTRVWSGSGMMGAESTLDPETEDAEIQPQSSATTESCLAIVNRLIEAMVSGECHGLLTAYCEEHPQHAWCVRRRGES